MEIKNYFAQDAQGNIMPSANCYLYLPGTTTLATGLVDGNGVPISNPFIASSVGQVEFGAPNGVYDLRVALGARDWTIKVQCADLLQALNETASFLGAKSSAPTTRNDGSALQIADRYFNTSDQLEYLYKSTGWVVNNLDGQLIATSQGASLVGVVMQDGSTGTVQQAITIGDAKLRQDLSAAAGGSIVHVKQDDANARDRSTLDVYRDSIDISDFVTYGDGRDEGVQLQRAINAAYAQGKTLVGRPGWTIGTSVQIDMNVRMSFHINGMNIIPIGRTSGKHITIKGVSLGVCDIKGLRAVVANGSVGTLGGVEIGDTVNAVQISGIDFKDWAIYGFDICLRFVGPNVFILNFLGCAISGASNRNVSYECTTNSGEAIRFIGGNISDAHNPSNTAVGVMVPPGVSPPDIRIDKLSMSYNDINGDIAVGIVEVTGVHEENKNVNEFWRIRNTVGAEKTNFTKIAGTMTPGPLSAGGEPAQGRYAFIVYDGSTSVTVRDVRLGQFRPATGTSPVADYITKVAAWSGIGGAAYNLRIENPIIDANRDTAIPLDICPEIDQAYLTGSGAFDGFTQNGASGMVFTSGTDGYGADTRNRSISRNAAGSGSASYNLKMPVKAGDTIVAKVACKTVGATACTFAGGRLIYFTANDFQLSVANLARSITTPNNAAYIVQFARDKAPKGAAYVILQMLASGLGDTGAEVRFSNEKLWVV